MQEVTTISIATLAVAMTILTGTLFALFFFLKKQIHEYRLHRDLALLQKMHDRITASRNDQELIYNQAQTIQTYITDEKSLSDIVNEDLRNAIYNIADIYQFIGFTIKQNLLSDTMKKAFFAEEGENFGRLYRLIAPLLQNERAKPYRRNYKYYFDYLYTEYKNYLKK